jgi:N-acetylglutamate synthase-like GNAT family acetyltransferase
VNVRRARTADAPAIAALLAELGYATDPAIVELRLAKLERSGPSAVLVAEREGDVAGVLALHMVPVLHEPGPWCRVTMLIVGEDARRRGLARALVTEAEAIARSHGCVRIEVTSAFHRDGAHEFYRGMGYGRVSEHFLKAPLLGDARE